MIVIAVLFIHYYLIIDVLSFDTLPKAEKEKIAEEEEIAERDRQLRLAANEEAKVSNVVDSSCKLTHYVLPIAW